MDKNGILDDWNKFKDGIDECDLRMLWGVCDIDGPIGKDARELIRKWDRKLWDTISALLECDEDTVDEIRMLSKQFCVYGSSDATTGDIYFEGNVILGSIWRRKSCDRL